MGDYLEEDGRGLYEVLPRCFPGGTSFTPPTEPPSSAKVRNTWNYISTHPFVFMEKKRVTLTLLQAVEAHRVVRRRGSRNS
jgi:hypothetical protein